MIVFRIVARGDDLAIVGEFGGSIAGPLERTHLLVRLDQVVDEAISAGIPVVVSNHALEPEWGLAPGQSKTFYTDERQMKVALLNRRNPYIPF